MAPMPIVFWVSTAFLVWALSYSVWCLAKNRHPVTGRPLPGVLLLTVLFVSVGWQAVTWLQAGHPEASYTRHIAVVLQAICSFGIVLVGLLGAGRTGPSGETVSRISQ